MKEYSEAMRDMYIGRDRWKSSRKWFSSVDQIKKYEIFLLLIIFQIFLKTGPLVMPSDSRMVIKQTAGWRVRAEIHRTLMNTPYLTLYPLTKRSIGQ